MDIKVIKEDESNQSVFIYQPNFLTTEEQDMLIKWLNNMDDFKTNMNYNETQIIRQQKWYQTENKYFCPEWVERYERWESHDYDEHIISLQTKIQSYIDDLILNKCSIDIEKCSINSCLINKYKDGKDKIRPHRDTYKSFGKKPTIIGLSLGCKRDIRFKRVLNDNNNNLNLKKDKELSHLNFEQTLESGSLFIMGGCSQLNFTHEIPESSTNDIRYSLTFREFKYDLSTYSTHS